MKIFDRVFTFFSRSAARVVLPSQITNEITQRRLLSGGYQAGAPGFLAGFGRRHVQPHSRIDFKEYADNWAKAKECFQSDEYDQARHYAEIARDKLAQIDGTSPMIGGLMCEISRFLKDIDSSISNSVHKPRL